MAVYSMVMELHTELSTRGSSVKLNVLADGAKNSINTSSESSWSHSKSCNQYKTSVGCAVSVYVLTLFFHSQDIFAS